VGGRGDRLRAALLQAQGGIVSKQEVQPLPGVLQPSAASALRAGPLAELPRIGDPEAKRSLILTRRSVFVGGAVGDSRLNLDRAAALALGDAVLDGILDERLHQHVRHRGAQRLFTGVDLPAEAVLEADLFKL
jgi:hypothetical protein